jgi:hypothetical protein
MKKINLITLLLFGLLNILNAQIVKEYEIYTDNKCDENECLSTEQKTKLKEYLKQVCTYDGLSLKANLMFFSEPFAIEDFMAKYYNFANGAREIKVGNDIWFKKGATNYTIILLPSGNGWIENGNSCTPTTGYVHDYINKFPGYSKHVFCHFVKSIQQSLGEAIKECHNKPNAVIPDCTNCNCSDTNLSTTDLANLASKYIYDPTGELKKNLNSPKVINDLLLLKSNYNTRLIYTEPIVTTSTLTDNARASYVEALKKAGLENNLIVLLGAKKQENIDNADVQALELYKTPYQSYKNLTTKTEFEKGYPTFHILTNNDLEGLKSQYNSVSNAFSTSVEAGNKALINKLKSDISISEAINGDKNGNGSNPDGSTDFNIKAKATVNGINQWGTLEAGQAGKGFAEGTTLLGGYNGAGLSKTDLEKIIGGIKMSNDAKYKFELITSTNNTEKIPNAITYAKEAKKKYNDPNWTFGAITYSGRVWIHEEVSTTSSNTVYRIDFKINVNAPDIPQELKNLPTQDKSEFEELASQTIANVFGIDRKGLVVEHEVSKNFSDVIKEVLLPIKNTIQCASTYPVWEGLFRKDNTQNSIKTLSWWQIGGQFVNLGIWVAEGEVPEEAYLPTSALNGKTPTIFDFGGATIGSICGVLSLGKNVTIAAAFASAGSAGVVAGGGLAIINSISSGSVQPIRDLFLPLIGPIETFKDQMQILAKQYPSVDNAADCERLSYQTCKASFTLIGDIILDVTGGGKLVGKLAGKMNKLGAAAANAAGVSPKLISNIDNLATSINKPFADAKAIFKQKYDAMKAKYLPKTVLASLAFAWTTTFHQVDIPNHPNAPLIESRASVFAEIHVDANKHTPPNSYLKEQGSNSGDYSKAKDIMNAYEKGTKEIAQFDQVKQQQEFYKLIEAAENRPKLEKYIIEKWGDDDDPEGSKCTYCARTVTLVKNDPNSVFEYKLCKDIAKLKLKAGADLPNKVCALPIITLSPIVKELLSNNFGKDPIIGLYKDINEISNKNEHLCNNVNNLNVGIVVAWKRITTAANSLNTAFSKDFELLKRIDEVQKSITKQNYFVSNTMTGFDMFLQIAVTETPCNTCPEPTAGSYASRFPKLDKMISNVLKVFPTQDGKPDFTSSFFKGEVLAGTLNAGVDANRAKRDGGHHMLNYMADRPFTDNATWIDRQFNYVSTQATNSGKEFDIYMGNNANIPIWFVECKSYAETTSLDIDQFIAYLSLIDNFSRLRYVFNDKKLDISAAKNKMKDVFNSTTRKDDIFNTIWANPLLKLNLFGSSLTKSQAQIQFYSLVNSFDDKIYIFVDVHY